MKKIPIEFEHAYDSDKTLAISLGRINIGPYIARLVFCPDGNSRLLIDQEAIDKGYVVGADCGDLGVTL